MKKFNLICGVALCVAPLLTIAAPDTVTPGSLTEWFDFENCSFCQTMVKDPALLVHTTWENHPISNGMMNIMTVDPAYAPAMARAEEQMKNLGARIAAGEIDPADLHLCGHCEAFGALMKNGVDVEEVRGDAAVVSLFTSGDPAIVAGLQEQARRDTAEMKALGPHEYDPAP